MLVRDLVGQTKSQFWYFKILWCLHLFRLMLHWCFPCNLLWVYESFSRVFGGITTICSCVAKVPCGCPHLPLLWDAGHRQWTATSLPSGTKADVVGLGGNSEGEMTSQQLAEAWRYETTCVKIFAGWTTWRLYENRNCVWIYLMTFFLAKSGWGMVLMFLDGV